MTSESPIHPHEDVWYAMAVFGAIKPKYALEIMGLLVGRGSLRWTDLKLQLTLANEQDVSSKTLSCALDSLKDNHLIERHGGQFGIYVATAEGRSVIAELVKLGEWARTNLTLPR